jgi:hypothetical protein
MRSWSSLVLSALLVAVFRAPVALAQSAEATMGSWTNPAPWPIVAIHTQLLPNGKVLSWEKEDSLATPGTEPAPGTLWDPETGTFTDATYTPIDLFCAGFSFLPDGRLFITGGHFKDHIGLRNTTIYDYATNSYTAGPLMNLGRWYPTNVTLPNGEVLIISGDYDRKTVNLLPQVRKTDGTLRNLTNAQLELPLYPRMHVAPNGKVFMSMPSKLARYLNTSGTGTWTNSKRSQCCFRSYGSSVMYANGKVLILGGANPPTATAEVIDLNAATPRWRYTNPMHFARRHQNATLLADGTVLVTGGTSASGFNTTAGKVLAAEIWDPATEIWTTVASMQTLRIYHGTAVLLLDGRVLSTGSGRPAGDPPGSDVGHKDFEIYSPPYLFNANGSLRTRPVIDSAPANVDYGEQFFVGTSDGPSIQKVTWIGMSTNTHAFNNGQRFTTLAFSQAGGGLNVTAPANANLAPPGPYLLFILNGAGTPSVAKVVFIN